LLDVLLPFYVYDICYHVHMYYPISLFLLSSVDVEVEGL